MAKPERYIYLGPNMLKYGLQKYQVFKGGLPKAAEELKAKHPLFNQLFATIDNMAKVEKDMATKGTPAYLALKQLTKEA